MLKAISFDVDGTLFDMKAMRIAFAWTALKNARFLKAFLTAREEVRARGALPDVRRAQDELVAERMRIPVEEAARLSKTVIDGEWVEIFSKVKPIRGLKDALSALAADGLLFCTVSDYPAAPKLVRLGIDHVTWSADCGAEILGALKPHPRAFEEAIRRLGVAPSEILHVGDRLDADIAGAMAAGMRAALFTGGNSQRHVPDAEREKSPAPELVFDDYAVLVEHVRADRRKAAS